MRVEQLEIIVMIHYYRHHHYYSSLSISDDHYHRHPYSITPINILSSLSISISISISLPSRENAGSINSALPTSGRVVQPLKNHINHAPTHLLSTIGQDELSTGRGFFRSDLDTGGDGGCCGGEEDERRMK